MKRVVIIGGGTHIGEITNLAGNTLTVTTPGGAEVETADLPEPRSVVADWLAGGNLVGQAASLRANRLSILATRSAELSKLLLITLEELRQ